MSGVVVVMFSSVNLDTLLPLMRTALERSISSPGDSINSNPPLNHMLCIAAIKEPNLKPSPSAVRPYLNMFHAGIVFVADERDLAEILEVAGMPSILTQTVQRDMSAAFVTGTLDQWKHALLRGCVSSTSTEVRQLYNQVYQEFSRLGLSQAFEVTVSPERPDRTFLLEHKK